MTPLRVPEVSEHSAGTSASTLAQLSSADVAELLAQGRLDVVVPLGSLEQHGPHLPLSTDLLTAEAIASRVAASVGGCVVAPCLPVGCSDHHLGYAGTASLPRPLLAETQVTMIGSLLEHGFGSAYVVTGHAGNGGAMVDAKEELDRRFPDRVVSFANWPSQRDAIHAVAEGLGLDPDVVGTHAGHYETSIMLMLHPDLVRMDRAVPGFIGPAHEASAILNSQGMAALSPTGVIGDPTNATSDAGVRYLDALVAHVVDGIRAHRAAQGEGL